MNTIQLECFLAVAEHLNFSKASQALKLTQPAVSHQIQTLEEELGVKLFIRHQPECGTDPGGNPVYAGCRPDPENCPCPPESGWESTSILFPLIWDATTIWS